MSLVDRTEVGLWFPLGVPPGLGVSGAQAGPIRNPRLVGPRGAQKATLAVVEVRAPGGRRHSQTLFFPVHLLLGDARGSWNKAAPKTSLPTESKEA